MPDEVVARKMFKKRVLNVRRHSPMYQALGYLDRSPLFIADSSW